MVKTQKNSDLKFIVNYRTMNNTQFIFLVIIMPFLIALLDSLDDFNLDDYKIIPSLEGFIAIEIIVLLMFLVQQVRNFFFKKKIYPQDGVSSEKFVNANLKLSKLKVKYYKDENYVSAVEKLISRNENEGNN
ncbi:MAG: hypothetical protein KKH01_04055 [Firmicutes bacterium]|nr:hypothetical protein [Bacillota bacterium]